MSMKPTSYNQVHHKAATTIQSAFRNYQSRKRIPLSQVIKNNPHLHHQTSNGTQVSRHGNDRNTLAAQALVATFRNMRLPFNDITKLKNVSRELYTRVPGNLLVPGTKEPIAKLLKLNTDLHNAGLKTFNRFPTNAQLSNRLRHVELKLPAAELPDGEKAHLKSLAKILVSLGAMPDKDARVAMNKVYLHTNGKIPTITSAAVFLTSKDNFGSNELYKQVFNGKDEIVKTLIEAGSELDTSDNTGYTPLHCAAQRGKIISVEILIKAGANPNKTNNDGYTPLDLAAKWGHTDIVDLIKAHQQR